MRWTPGFISAAAAAAVVFSGPGQAKAQSELPLVCQSAKYTITLVDKSTDSGTTTWEYEITGSKNNLSKVNSIVAVKNRELGFGPSNVTGGFIQKFDFCEQDTETGINRNCESWGFDINPSAGTNKEKPFSFETDVASEGRLTFNIVAGSGIETCEADIPGGLGGMAGPGTLTPGEIDLVTTTQQVVLAAGTDNECTAELIFDVQGNLVNVNSADCNRNQYSASDFEVCNTQTNSCRTFANAKGARNVENSTVLVTTDSPGCLLYFIPTSTLIEICP